MQLPRLLRPLGARDYALLWCGMATSMVGDGIFFVALAWQVYDLSGSPTALALVNMGWSIGLVCCLVLGGLAADRYDRRVVMVCADGVRLAAMVVMAALTLGGVVTVFELGVLALVLGSAEGFFTPSFSALIPRVVPTEHLVQANSLQEVMRPLAFKLLGPAIGGVLVAAFDAGTAFVVDAVSFALVMACVAAIRARPGVRASAPEPLRRQVAEAAAFVRRRTWLWSTLVISLVAVLMIIGPNEVLLPYVIRHHLHDAASTYGTVLGVGGAAGVLAAIVLGQTGLPERAVGLMYLAWAINPLMLVGFGLANAVWQLVLFSAIGGAGLTVGTVCWATLLQRRVPDAMLGRVSSLDWLVSMSLTPLSFAIVGPVAALAGASATLIGAGLVGCAATAVAYVALPALRADRLVEPSAQPGDVAEEAGVADLGGVHPVDLDTVARR